MSMTSDIWTNCKSKIKKVDLVIGVRLSGKMFISVLTNWELGAEQFSCLSSRTFQTARGPSWLKAFSDFDWTEMCSNKQAFSLTRRVMFLQNNIPVKNSWWPDVHLLCSNEFAQCTTRNLFWQPQPVVNSAGFNSLVPWSDPVLSHCNALWSSKL